MGRPPCNFPVSLSKDEVLHEEAPLSLQAVTPHQQEGAFADGEDEARTGLCGFAWSSVCLVCRLGNCFGSGIQRQVVNHTL